MAEKPWLDKSYLYDRYVQKKMNIEQIAQECRDNGSPVTSMTIYNHLKKHELIRNSRNLGKRAFGKKPGTANSGAKKKRFY